MDNPTAVMIRQALEPFKRELIKIKKENEALRAMAMRPRSPTEEIDAIPGRRIFYTLTDLQVFDATLNGRQGPAISMRLSQDGPFIMTHYPAVMWRPTLPADAADFGRWRPVASYPLPDQVLDTNIIDISYQIVDTGSQRNFQSASVLPALISTMTNILPLPVPTLFTPNTVIQFIPTYERILFGGSPETTQGALVVALPGYRVVNM